MKSNGNKTTKSWKQFGAVALAVVALVLVVLRFETRNSAQAASVQATFHSPADAAEAIYKAAKSNDEDMLARILGAKTKALLTLGDKEADKTAEKAFVSKYEKMNRWVAMSEGSRVLYIGADNFAFPVPLAKNPSGQWYFDAVAGAEEIRARDIGRNELLAIDDCSALVGAQRIYFSSSPSATFAQRIISSAGRQDGLYWPASEQPSSPLAGLSEFPKSSLPSLSPDQPLVIDGYTLRILMAQGAEAPGGAKSYIVDGKMTGGFAILATPVHYAETGIMAFMTGSDGMVYERDLGPDTQKIAASIQEFNPTEDWSPAQ